MENTPTPYQRQRRAGRLSPQPEQIVAPPTQDAQLPLQQPIYADPQPVQQPLQVRSDVPVHIPYPSVQQQPAPTQAQSVQQLHPGLTPAHPLPQSSGNRQPRSLQQQPAASSGWRMPSQQPVSRTERPTAASPQSAYRSAPAGARPQASVNGHRGFSDAPVSRSSKPKTDSSSATDAQRKPVEKRKTPSWMLTLMSLMFIGVLALVAFDFLMQAYLKTAADERQTAYEATLFNYHVTEQEDGTLRVTWQDMIEKYAEQYNLNPAFVTAVIRNESSFRTNAESSAGARGLMQMMPDTAEWIAGKLHDSYDFDKLYDAETSIRYGCWYLNYLSELFRGDPVLVSAAYHAGQGEVWGWLGDPAISPDGVSIAIDNIPISNTKTYAGRVTQAYGIYQTLLYPDNASSSPVPSDSSAASVLFAAADR